MKSRTLLLVAVVAVIGVSTLLAETAPKGDENLEVGSDDPYRWLEDVHGDKALDWVRKKDTRTKAALPTSASRDRFIE